MMMMVMMVMMMMMVIVMVIIGIWKMRILIPASLDLIMMNLPCRIVSTKFTLPRKT